jgi:hypothetical protein
MLLLLLLFAWGLVQLRSGCLLVQRLFLLLLVVQKGVWSARGSMLL